MNIDWPNPGKYIVAVSGGVDSVALLDMLARRSGYELVVAHVDHGIRTDSGEDAKLVLELAQKYHLGGVQTVLNFEKNTPENRLRQARYDFLFKIMKQEAADGVITAHHADDVIETSIINVLRGTDRYGAAGGMGRQNIIRPFLHVRKQQLIDYATKHHLEWREDSTNKDTTYTRNHVRHKVIPGINRDEYQQYLTELDMLNKKIDSLLNGKVLIENRTARLSRRTINELGLRELEVLLAFSIRNIDPGHELTQPQVADLAREILRDATKNSFSYDDQTGIIIEIQ